jgi:hypothetical protein
MADQKIEHGIRVRRIADLSAQTDAGFNPLATWSGISLGEKRTLRLN